VNFAQTDHATLSFSRGTSVGIDGGVTLSRRLAGRSELVLDVLVSAQQSTSKATLSTNPTTTSTQPGAIVFSTPSGTRTIVISTTPGVTSSLSQPVSDHPVVTAKGWSVGPAVRIGITF